MRALVLFFALLLPACATVTYDAPEHFLLSNIVVETGESLCDSPMALTKIKYSIGVLKEYETTKANNKYLGEASAQLNTLAQKIQEGSSPTFCKLQLDLIHEAAIVMNKVAGEKNK